MKTAIPFLLFLFICLIDAQAQPPVQAGDFLVDGRLRFKVGSQADKVVNPPSGLVQPESMSDLNLFFGPSLLYFLTPAFALGGTAKVDMDKWGDQPAQTSFGIGPELLMLHALSTQLYFMAKVGMLYTLAEAANKLSFFIGPGLAYFVAQGIAVQSCLTYRYRSSTREGGYFFNNTAYDLKTTKSSIGFSIGLAILLRCGSDDVEPL